MDGEHCKVTLKNYCNKKTKPSNKVEGKRLFFHQRKRRQRKDLEFKVEAMKYYDCV